MDAKSLLRAKKAEARITHPYATYTAAGVMRCSICAVPVKQWDAHLLTKQHRTSVAREKSGKEREKEKENSLLAQKHKQSKRSAPTPLPESSFPESSSSSSKRARVSRPDEEENGEPSGLPAGFFSNKRQSRSPSVSVSPDGEAEAGPSSTSLYQDNAKPTGDSELDDFLSSLNEDDPTSTATSIPTASTQASTSANQGNRRKTYKEVIPGQATYEAAPIKITPVDQTQDQIVEEEPEESEQEKKERLEKEEREEIVKRLEDEERAQEDADSRVASLKARMEMLKKRREAKSGGGKTKSTVTTNGA
ncbi:uncharacterized protein IL334_006814 [Kwoniella shivajii]|uniref:Zinc finger protein 830 n=1 Tax=Kwoniella shivajii TaxID=564305 RepID=A0ABZ1D7N7_9TREE|nr:hypothetical protein IL334_006814 [Kwoniella shivajii]